MTVSSATDEDVPFEADGELLGYAPVTFQVGQTGHLRVLAPPPREWEPLQRLARGNGSPAD